MNFSNLYAQVTSPEIPQMPRELSWAIIALLAAVLAYVIVRYTMRIDKMLERLDDAVDAIKQTLISHAGEIKGHETRITRLEGDSKTTKRRP